MSSPPPSTPPPSGPTPPPRDTPPPAYEEVVDTTESRREGRQVRVLVTASPVFIRRPLPPWPVEVICPVCGAHIRTTTYRNYSVTAHISAILLCLLGCWICSLMPYCIPSCQITHHFCPACHNYLGTSEQRDAFF